MTSISFEWNWKSRTQTLLLVFYFSCDRRQERRLDVRSNIRTEECYGGADAFHVFSWAPSHTEQGLIGSLLNLANIVNGYKPEKKYELANDLMYHRYTLNQSTVHRLSTMIRGVT